VRSAPLASGAQGLRYSLRHHSGTMPKRKQADTEIKKTMIYLDAKVHEQLRRISFEERISIAEIVRQAVDQHLHLRKRKRRGR
jgi:hypothetical protein